MKVGQRVWIKELGLQGNVESVNSRGVASTVRITDSDGQAKVINTLHYTVTILTIVNSIAVLLKSIWVSIKGKQ
jgi:hypothetical protein